MNDDPVPANRRQIVNGQVVTDEKRVLSRRLRREMTAAEARLWACLRGRRLGGAKFRRQQVIDGFVADFYCAAAGLVVELDGPVHADRAEYDAARDEILARRGLRTFRVTNARLDHELAVVLAEIDLAVREANG